MYPTFETERLYLQPCTLDDADFMLALLNTPKWLAHIGDRKVYTINDAQKYITDRITPQFEQVGFGSYTVIRKTDSTKIGSCGLYNREGLEGVDIGFAFLPEYEKQGYAYESAACILHAAQHTFGLERVNAITTRENKDSQKLLEKIGLTYRKIVNIPDDPEDLLFYSIEWK